MKFSSVVWWILLVLSAGMLVCMWVGCIDSTSILPCQTACAKTGVKEVTTKSCVCNPPPVAKATPSDSCH